MTYSPIQCAQRSGFRAHVVIIAVCSCALMDACSKNANVPVAPDIKDYDTTMIAHIPSGTFRMGNITKHPDGWVDERPVHEVTITRPFLIGRTEVTQARYEAIMGTNPSSHKGQELPVESVSWYEAVEFCNALSRREGLDTCYSGSGANIFCDFTANGYRLPTEAEWEYACRAGTETDFHTGDMTNSYGFDPALARAGWFGENENSTTQPVGKKEPNAFGLYDMHGNVDE